MHQYSALMLSIVLATKCLKLDTFMNDDPEL